MGDRLQSYRDLLVWQKSIELVTEIYRLTEHFPKTEMFGLTNQMRRSAISIPSNIAEGYARRSRAEYLQFLRIAFGSGAELETQILISQNLGLFETHDPATTKSLLEEVMKILNKLISTLTTKP